MGWCAELVEALEAGSEDIQSAHLAEALHALQPSEVDE